MRKGLMLCLIVGTFCVLFVFLSPTMGTMAWAETETSLERYRDLVIHWSPRVYQDVNPNYGGMRIILPVSTSTATGRRTING